MHAEMESRVRTDAGGLPLFAVAGWVGARMLGEWGWQDHALATAGLAHGGDALDESSPSVTIYTIVGDPVLKVVGLISNLLGPPRDGEQMSNMFTALRDQATETALLRVDSQDVEFRVWRWTDRWWASAMVDGYGLVIQGINVALSAVALNRVDDIEPYLAGRRQVLARLRIWDTP